MLRKILLLSFAALILAAVSYAVYRQWRFNEAFGNGHAKLVYKETPLGPKLPGCVSESVTRSPDDRAIAYVVKRGDKTAVVWNGVEQKAYDKAGYWTVENTAELERLRKQYGNTMNYQVPPLQYKALVLSKDGRHIAYLASSREGQLVVHDGNEGRMYEEIGPFYDDMSGEADKTCDLVLSEDGEHVAYTAKRGSEWFVVTGSAVSGPYGSVISESLKLSKGAEHLAYVACAGGKTFVVSDGVNQEAFDEIRMGYMSPDGKRIAYWANKDGSGYVVVDGVALGPYDTFDMRNWGWSPMEFSPDSKRLAYVALRDGKALMVCDGVEGKPYDEIESKQAFSEDGKHFAYVGAVGKKSQVNRPGYSEIVKGDQKDVLVVDGAETRQYDEVYRLEYRDGNTLTYVARRGNEQFVVIDGREGPKCRAAMFPEYLLRPDGTAVIYSFFGNHEYSPLREYLDKFLAKLPWRKMEGYYDRQYPVVSGVRGKAYDQIGCIMFSADRRHTLYVSETWINPNAYALMEVKQVFVVDGREAPQHAVPSDDYSACYDDPEQCLRFFVEDNTSLKTVDVRVVPD